MKKKYSNSELTITIFGKSTIYNTYYVQVKIYSNKSKSLLNEIGQIETCYRLTRNAVYTEKELKAIIKKYKLEA